MKIIDASSTRWALIQSAFTFVVLTLITTGLMAQDSEIKLTSAGPIAFGPNGVLMVSDHLGF